MTVPLVAAGNPLLYDLLTQPVAARHAFLRDLAPDERRALLAAYLRDYGTAFLLWHDDPVGFWRMVLGGYPWSRQVELCESVETNPRTASPSSPSVGKTYTAAMLVAWFGSVHPPNEVQIVTTAPKMRQVRHLLWPHIHQVHASAGLPGDLDQTQWKIGGRVIGYGFSAADYDEDAVQGIHAPHLLVVGDEAGGLSHTIGRGLEGLTTGGHTRLFLIGNPPTDDEGSYFEERCASPLWNVVRIAATDSPNLTGEPMPAHILPNLVDQRWIDDVVAEFGEDSNFVEARVHARFPHGSTQKTIPFGWIEDAMSNENPDPSTWVRVGVDVAADGGDELAIAVAVGNTVKIVHTSSGAQNANPTDVAGQALEVIHEAERLRQDLADPRPVRVKVDAIGVGWAVAGLLRAWASEKVHPAQIVDVVVSESAKDDDRYMNKRAEMWWCARELIRPRVADDARGQPARPPVVKLDIDRKTAAQLNAPKYGHDSRGRIKIEPKADIKRRGIGSPDRAEAVLLALYEPVGLAPARTYNPNRYRTTVGRDPRRGIARPR